MATQEWKRWGMEARCDFRLAQQRAPRCIGESLLFELALEELAIWKA
jgi:hypothetical protein